MCVLVLRLDISFLGFKHMPLTPLEKQLYEALKEAEFGSGDAGWIESQCPLCAASQNHDDDCTIGKALKAAEEKK